MRLLLTVLLLFAPAVCLAASPESDYFATRDAQIASIKALDDAKKGEDALKQQETAKADLTAKLRQIVGPVAIKGFAPTGTANIGSLFAGDADSGLLDGLLFPAADDTGFLVVTTETLLQHWLAEHKEWWGANTDNVPQQIPDALASDALYTQAVQTDAAISRYAALPVKKPAGVQFAYAMLVARSQVFDPTTPDELLVAMVKGGRVFIASAPATVKVRPIPACARVWADSQRQTATLQQAYVASGLKDENLSNQRDAAENQGVAAFHRCFAERAAAQPFFAPLVKQAQALVERLDK